MKPFAILLGSGQDDFGQDGAGIYNYGEITIDGVSRFNDLYTDYENQVYSRSSGGRMCTNPLRYVAV